MASGGCDPKLRELTNTFKPLLVKFLQLKTGFLTSLNAFLSPDDLYHLQALEQQNRTAAVLELLDILARCQKLGVYAAFIGSLKSNKMENLAEMIEKGNGPSKRSMYYRFLIECFLPKLIEINPVDILPYLPCLTNEDIEEITNVQTQVNSTHAALKLLVYLNRHGEEGFGQLIDGLRKTRHRRLASAIAVGAGKQSEGINPKTFASEEQEFEDFFRCTEKTSAPENGFDNSDLYDDDDGDTSETVQVANTIRNEAACLELCDEQEMDIQYDLDPANAEEHTYKSHDEELRSSLAPDDEGSFNIKYTSLSCNDNLDYEEEDNQESEFLESFANLQISEKLESQCSNKGTRPRTPQSATSADVNIGEAKHKRGRPRGSKNKKPREKPKQPHSLSGDFEIYTTNLGSYTDRKNTSSLNIAKIRHHPKQLQSPTEYEKSQDDSASPTQSDDTAGKATRKKQPPKTKVSQKSPETLKENIRAALKQKSKQHSRDTPEPAEETKSLVAAKLTNRQRSRDSPEPPEETLKSRTPQKTTNKQRGSDSPQETAKEMSAKSKVKTSTTGKTTKTKPDQRVKKVEITEPKQHTIAPLKSSTAKPSTMSIVGKVINADAKWASNCCNKCFKIVENKDKLVCKKCKTRFSDVSVLVQRLVAEVTLKTEDGKTIKKMCHGPELKVFFKENGDTISNHRSVDKLSTYLKNLKSLELLLDGKGDVSKISKHYPYENAGKKKCVPKRAARLNKCAKVCRSEQERVHVCELAMCVQAMHETIVYEVSVEFSRHA
ncbi:uncharacterized protein [Amphiura filiformis]|uniref:uncharacterized protein n=1 Tax=Amphiura filiformis TaxID=82378 RepID=UPI003B21F9F0